MEMSDQTCRSQKMALWLNLVPDLQSAAAAASAAASNAESGVKEDSAIKHSGSADRYGH